MKKCLFVTLVWLLATSSALAQSTVAQGPPGDPVTPWVGKQAGILLDAMDATTGWADGGDTQSLAVSLDHAEGTAALTFDKVNTLSNTPYGEIEKTLTTPLDLTAYVTNGVIRFSMRIPDPTLVSRIQVRLGTDSSHYTIWTVTPNKNIFDEWFQVSIPLSTPSQTSGNGWNSASVSWIRIGIQTEMESNVVLGIIVDAPSVSIADAVTTDEPLRSVTGIYGQLSPYKGPTITTVVGDPTSIFFPAPDVGTSSIPITSPYGILYVSPYQGTLSDGSQLTQITDAGADVANITGTSLDVTTPRATATGTLDAINETVEINLDGQRSAGFALWPTACVCTLMFEHIAGNGDWEPTFALDLTGAGWVPTITNPGIQSAEYVAYIGGYERGYRVRMLAYTSGSVIVEMTASTMTSQWLITAGADGSTTIGGNGVGGRDDADLFRSLRLDDADPAGTEYGLITRNIPSGTQAVSAASLPLPTGASTSAIQTDGTQKTQIVDSGGAVVNATGTSLDVNCTGGCGGAATFADNSAFTFGTTPIGNIGAVVDDTAPNAVAENSAGAPRMAANRVLYGQIRDAAGNERGANVTASNALVVDGSAVTQPVSSTNLDIRDLTFAADKVDASGTVLGAGTNNIGDVDVLTFPDNEPFNVAQIGGNAVTTGNGVSGAGVQRVAVASDNSNAPGIGGSATGSAVPAAARYVGGSDGTNLVGYYIDPCQRGAKTYLPFSITTATTTQLVAASASNKVYVCSIVLVTAAANNVALVEDDTAACASPTAGMSGGTTAASGWNLSANGGLALGNGASAVASTAATNRYVCFITSAATQLSGTVSYVLAP